MKHILEILDPGCFSLKGEKRDEIAEGHFSHRNCHFENLHERRAYLRTINSYSFNLQR